MNPREWAATRSPDQRVDVGGVALRVAAYERDGRRTASPIEGLVVTDVASGKRGLWHESTGVYGFLELPHGTRTFRVEDPARRWLPRLCTAAAPDRRSLRAALERGATPPADDPGPTWADVPLYPTTQLLLAPTETVVWGVVHHARTPVPWAYVIVAYGALRYRGSAGPDGSYTIWLRGARPTPAEEDLPFVPRPITVHRAVPARIAAAVLPAGFDTLTPGAAAPFTDNYVAVGKTVPRHLPVGTRTRVDVDLSLP